MSFRDQLGALGFRSYDEYLASEHWADLRRRFYASKLFKGRCHACPSRTGLNVHHKTYKRLGHEWLQDLVALCRDCHQAVHALERERGTKLANVTRWFIRQKWLELGSRPKRTGRWGRRYQQRVNELHAGGLNRPRGQTPPLRGAGHAVRPQRHGDAAQ